MSDQDAPQVTGPAPDPSVLGSIVGPAPTQAPTLAPQGNGSRLTSILQAVAHVATTGLASIPSHGRASFLNGATDGARGAQAADAQQQAIKFKTFDDSMRAASLHNQDLELQGRQQEQSDAHQKAQDTQHDWDEAHGLAYDEIPNTGSAVTDHLTAQTSANGTASIVPGTHLSADGKSILIPKQTSDVQAAQLLKYNTFREAYNLPSLPHGAQFVPNKNLDMLQNKLEGHSLGGDIYKHEELPGAIADLQSTRDSLAKKGGTNTDVLKQVDGTIASMQAKSDFLDDHADEVAARQTAQAAAKAKAVSDATLANKEALQDNAASDKPVKAVDPDWKPGVTASQKNKADLAENMISNINSVNSILAKRPDLVGAVAGRYTTGEQMIGNNDPDISALGTAIHNIGMANNGIHGMKANEGVHDFEKLTLNGFKNGPQAIAGALGESTKSVQTFIDAARPNTYKTSTAQGGASLGMGGGPPAPQTHSFSLGAWQKANPRGDASAARAAAQKQGFQVVQ